MKAILFDCDGTLVDSEYAHYLSWQHALLYHGKELPLEEYPLYVGKSAAINAHMLAQKAGIDCASLILQMKRDYFHQLCTAGFSPISPTVELLKSLAAEKEARGMKIGVCSAASRKEIFLHLKHLQIDHLLDIVLSGQEDLEDYHDPEGVNKPKPYIYLHAMKQLGVSPSETVVIEDSAPGAAAGVAAGCFTIAIPNEFTRHQDFSHADLRVDSFKDMNANSFLELVLR